MTLYTQAQNQGHRNLTPQYQTAAYPVASLLKIFCDQTSKRHILNCQCSSSTDLAFNATN